MKVGDSFYLGYIAKAIGNQGELAFKLDVDSPSSYQSLDSVLVQMFPKDEQLVPYFTENARLQNNGSLRVKVEGVNSLDEAKTLVGKSLFLPLDRLPKLSGNQFYFHEITGFEVEDQEKGVLGKVEKVIEYSTSNLLSIPHGEKEILIPISKETIIKLDREARKLTVKAPEGLIDLYLEES